MNTQRTGAPASKAAKAKKPAVAAKAGPSSKADGNGESKRSVGMVILEVLERIEDRLDKIEAKLR